MRDGICNVCRVRWPDGRFNLSVDDRIVAHYNATGHCHYTIRILMPPNDKTIEEFQARTQEAPATPQEG